MIQYQILQTNITRTVWETVRRITNEILGVKGLMVDFQDTQTASYVVKTKALVFFSVLRRVKIKLELS